MRIQAESVSPSGPRNGDLLVQVVADLEILGRGLDGGLVHHTVALQRVHVADPDPAAGLGHRQEQVAADAQVAQHQVPPWLPARIALTVSSLAGSAATTPRKGAIGSVMPWVNSAVVRASSKGK